MLYTNMYVFIKDFQTIFKTAKKGEGGWLKYNKLYRPNAVHNSINNNMYKIDIIL